MCDSFIDTLQSIPEQDLCGMTPINPLGDFPNDFMTCVYQMNGFQEQYIFVGQSYGYNEPQKKGY